MWKLLLELNQVITDWKMHNEPMNLWEMANLSPRTTGINGFIIFVSTGNGVKHAARIKVCKGNKWKPEENATITIEGIPRIIGDIGITPDEFNELVQWITLNREPLLQYWYGGITYTEDLLAQLKPLTL